MNLPAANKPLSGVKVIDMTSVIMGPVTTQILGDYGADVIKIEAPDGDVMRYAGPMKDSSFGPLFNHANRNKRSVVLDLKQERVRSVMLQLISKAEIFVHNVRSEAMERLGLSYSELIKVNPNLIYIELTGYGSNGPYAGRPAVDDVIQGAVGIPSLLARVGAEEPTFFPVLVADRMVGVAAAHAALAAYIHRLKTGKGQRIEVPMFETMASFILSDHSGGHAFDPPIGPTGYNRLLSKQRRPYKTQDGYIAVTLYTDRHWKRFFDQIQRPDIFDDNEIFHSAKNRFANIDAVYTILAEFLATRPTKAWEQLLTDIDVPFARIASIEDLFNDPHLLEVGLLETIDIAGSAFRTPGIPSLWSGVELTIERPPPRLGEHTIEVLLEAGLTQDEIHPLMTNGCAIQASSDESYE